MPVSIGSNITSLKAQRRLSEGTADLSKTYEKLSSGLRINSASDDAAGLAISESLKTDKRVFTQGIRNLGDGVSLLNIADSAVESLSGIVIRLKELAEQSANGTLGSSQRKSLDAEAQALSEEYFRISNSTKFNGRSLFDGSTGELRLQAGYGTDGSIVSGLGGAIGTGNLNASATYSMNGGSGASITLADINNDGIQDMVSAGGTDVCIRLGSGSGTFGAEVSYQMDIANAFAVTFGDLNGDGILDLVSNGMIGGGRANVRLGMGDGTFGTVVSYQMELGATISITLGDLNGDGILDMVSAGHNGTVGQATTRLGAGNGTFGAARSYQTESGGSSEVRLADLNDDGILDLVTGGNSGGVGYATVRLGVGDGSFGTASSFQMHSAQLNSITFGDLNDDGNLDIVSVGNGAGVGQSSVRLGTGDGSFGSAVSYQMGTFRSNSVEVGDLNGDGILDVVTGGYDSSYVGSVTLRLGIGNGTFGAARSFLTQNDYTSDLFLGDMNEDGVLDVVTMGFDALGIASNTSILSQNSTSGISPLLTFNLTTRAGALQALPVFTKKLDQLARQRGAIGAFQARIEVAANNLQVSAENFTSAASRITDVDVAEESSRLIRLNILQQASASVLSQANLQPQLALRLLS